MPDEQEGFHEDPEQPLSARVGTIEQKVDQILGIIGKGEHSTQQAAQHHEEEKLDRPTSVAEEIRRQFDERDRRAARAAKEKEHTDRVGALEATVQKITESAPEPPARRVEKIMGWR